MRIDSSSISMASARTYKAEAEISQTAIDRRYGNGLQQTLVNTSTTKVRQLEVEAGGSVYINNETASAPEGQNQSSQQVSSRPSGDAAAQQNALQQAASMPSGSDWLSDVMEKINNDPTIQMLRKALDLLNRFTGKKSAYDPFSFASQGQKRAGAFQVSASAASLRYQSTMAAFGMEAPVVRGEGEGVNGFWTRQTVQSAFVKGEEHTAFSSVGTVVTADGRTIDFGISVEMSRSFEEAYELVGQEAVYTDPLVINLDTDAASLSDVSFYFDLDGDGTKEQISGLGEGSGFLALDKNGDGKINDGSELFGAKTGNGFAELGQYDQDGNGWIDENDEVFSKLSVWVKCGTGDSKLISLKDAGVGAIFLGSQSTQHTLADSSGSENAVVRRTGVYLKENGQAGTVQHIDFKR